MSKQTYEQQARQRVASDLDLAAHKDILIDYDWDNQEEHYQWVATAGKAEILSWVRSVRQGEEE
jgi:hypothetical protein